MAASLMYLVHQTMPWTELLVNDGGGEDESGDLAPLGEKADLMAGAVLESSSPPLTPPAASVDTEFRGPLLLTTLSSKSSNSAAHAHARRQGLMRRRGA